MLCGTSKDSSNTQFRIFILGDLFFFQFVLQSCNLVTSTWIGWWIMCWTVGCPVTELGPTAGLSTVVPLELDITAAAAAPAPTRQVRSAR